MSEIILTELNEIMPLLDSAEDERTVFYCYRLPNREEIHFSKDCEVCEGILQDSFVVGTYNGKFYSLLPNGLGKDLSIPLIQDATPETSREIHVQKVAGIVDALKENGGGKCVLSRVISHNRIDTLGSLFFRIANAHPEAFVFAYAIPQAGIWIGASPELLLKLNKNVISTMSLAGTRVAGTSGDWDEKNLEEQAMVTEFIAEVFDKYCENIKVGTLTTRTAGPVEHLCTEITGEIEFGQQKSIEQFLTSLSPTPALLGFPRNFARNLIAATETHQRECYGGFCGPIGIDTASLYVNVRSASFCDIPWSIRQYVGGGITTLSNPAAEWEETVSKSQSLPL